MSIDDNSLSKPRRGPARITVDPATGTVSFKLTVVAPSSLVKGRRYIGVRCACGTEKTVLLGSFLSGHTKSCGCLSIALLKQRSVSHGMSSTNIYHVWGDMRQRCLNPLSSRYAYYGGRGITCDEAWEDFEVFYKDMGEPPFKGATLERLDTNGNYCKDNCAWASQTVQNNNKRSNVFWEYKGEMYSLKQLSKLSGLGVGTLTNRLYLCKWPVARAVETPILSRSEYAHLNPESGEGAIKHRLYPQQPTQP